MRFYVKHYQLEASNTHQMVHEMGSASPVGVLVTQQNFQIQCELIPVLDKGESAQDILDRLALWLNGAEVNMVRAQPDKPRCFFCGTINDTGKPKCPQCGGEMGYGANNAARLAQRSQ